MRSLYSHFLIQDRERNKTNKIALHVDAKETMNHNNNKMGDGGFILLRSVCVMYSFSCWIYELCSAFGVYVSTLVLFLADCIAVAYLQLLTLLHYHQFNVCRSNKVGTTITTTALSLLNLSTCTWRLSLCHEIRTCQVIQKFISRRFYCALLPCKTVKPFLLVPEPNWMDQWVVAIVLAPRHHQQYHAAVRLQRFWRSCCCIWRKTKEKDDFLADNIVMIQSCVRQWLIRRREQTQQQLSAARSSSQLPVLVPRKYSCAWIQRAIKHKHGAHHPKQHFIQLQEGGHVVEPTYHEATRRSRRYHQRERMAVKMALYRHWQGQMIINQRQQNYATTLIQCLWRGYSIRRCYHCRSSHRHHHHQSQLPYFATTLKEIQRSHQHQYYRHHHHHYHHYKVNDEKYDRDGGKASVKKVLFPNELDMDENKANASPCSSSFDHWLRLLGGHPNSAFDSSLHHYASHRSSPLCNTEYYDTTRLLVHDDDDINQRSSRYSKRDRNNNRHKCPQPPPNTPSEL